MMQLRAYGIFNGKNIYKLEAVLFRAQVSARSGRLLWPPGGAVIGQREKGAMSTSAFHGNRTLHA